MKGGEASMDWIKDICARITTYDDVFDYIHLMCKLIVGSNVSCASVFAVMFRKTCHSIKVN